MSDTTVSYALDTRPLLGEVARLWQRIAPFDLTVPEIFALMHVLQGIADRLDNPNPPLKGSGNESGVHQRRTGCARPDPGRI
ncbi:hypothetical protein BST11_16950 [Mycobacterium alsense]|uniref:Uncharacterized protein n=1 Tax=Mycobacterium alsense TaxID=324058 RepID=A0AA41XT72_9MYCO|nr:hypothetical protein [Mycobacterium alsense]MCV7381457.1 hypothetical protein [Mycobacterium alsense]OQZ89517.1 hypothetical protein BST11_16950 [Mycobacterium alsense]